MYSSVHVDHQYKFNPFSSVMSKDWGRINFSPELTLEQEESHKFATLMTGR